MSPEEPPTRLARGFFHLPPDWVATDSNFFITINCKPRGADHLSRMLKLPHSENDTCVAFEAAHCPVRRLRFLLRVGRAAPGSGVARQAGRSGSGDGGEGSKLTSAQVKKEPRRFLMKKGVESKNSKAAKPVKPDDRVTARTFLKKLEAELGRFVSAERYRPLLDHLLALINQDISQKPA